MSTPEPSLEARVDQLEADRENLYATFRAVDGEFHEAIARHRVDRKLILALRTTQIEHGRVLAGLVKGQSRLEAEVAGLKTDVAALTTDVAGLRTDMFGLRTDAADVKGSLGRLEQLVRQGFNLPPEEA